MKKIMFLTNLMCVFVLGFTQAKAEKLKSYMPEKTGIENHTVEDFIEHCSSLDDEKFLYYIGSQLRWSAENTKISPTESVYDRMVKLKYAYAFGDAATMRTWLPYLFRDSKALEGQIKTAGIGAISGARTDLTRLAYANELPFMIDWNFLEIRELSDPSAPIYFGADVDPVQIFSAKCGNPLYPARLGGGYTPLNQSAQRSGEVASTSVAAEQRETQTSGGGTTIINNYYDNEAPVSFEENDGGYVDDRAKWYFSFGLNLNVGPQYANTHCGGYGGGYGYGYAGNSYGQCSHGHPYQQFAYQPSGGGNPQNINIEVINQITNTATATATNNNTNTNTNTTTVNNNGHGHGNPNPNPNPNPGNPTDPPNGDPNDGEPLDPPNGRNARRMEPRENPYQSNFAAVTQTRPESRPTTSQGTNSRPDQFQTTTPNSTVMSPRDNYGNQALTYNETSRPDSRPSTTTSTTSRPQSRQETAPAESSRTGRNDNVVRTNPGNYGYGNQNQNPDQRQARSSERQQSYPQQTQTQPDLRQQRGYGNQSQSRQQVSYNQAPAQGNGGGFQQGGSQGGSRSGGRR